MGDAQLSNGYVGSSWRIETVTTPDTTLTLRSGINAWLSFGSDGTLLGGDSVNAFSGRYASEEDGYRPSDVAMTLIGYLGDDKHVRAAMAALRVVTADGALVRVEVHGNSLVLTAPGGEFRCLRTGPSTG